MTAKDKDTKELSDGWKRFLDWVNGLSPWNLWKNYGEKSVEGRYFTDRVGERLEELIHQREQKAREGVIKTIDKSFNRWFYKSTNDVEDWWEMTKSRLEEEKATTNFTGGGGW